jgi:hypothetical protein
MVESPWELHGASGHTWSNWKSAVIWMPSLLTDDDISAMFVSCGRGSRFGLLVCRYRLALVGWHHSCLRIFCLRVIASTFFASWINVALAVVCGSLAVTVLLWCSQTVSASSLPAALFLFFCGSFEVICRRTADFYAVSSRSHAHVVSVGLVGWFVPPGRSAKTSWTPQYGGSTRTIQIFHFFGRPRHRHWLVCFNFSLASSLVYK